MKRNHTHIGKILAAICLAGVLTAGCTKRLDIGPYQSISESAALNTEEDVMVTLIGAYDGLQSAAGYGGEIMVLNELIGNSTNIQFTGTFAGLVDAWNGIMVSNNSFATSTWAVAYNCINRANNVLSAIDKVTSSPAKKASVEGEALFLRAAMHFELVRLYAKFVGDGDANANPGVPLVLTPTRGITDADYRPRASVKAVYDQVIADLTKAETQLPSSNGFYATKWAAAAMLARVQLMNKNYTAAGAAANRVIGGSGRTLNTDFKRLWFTFIDNGGSMPTEYLFGIKVTTQDGTNALNTYFGRNVGIPGTAGRSDCKIRPAHIALYSANDKRRYFFLSGGSNYTGKHLDRYGDVPVIRLAEMILTRAECNFRNSTTLGATPLADVNAIRTRAGLTALTVSQLNLAAITRERYLELAFEGHSLPEVKRLQTTLGNFSWNSPKLIMPIPQREMDVNKQLVQNVGY
ncbi:MAG: RagB/SusD family nutrient uptake outer membrane protein [Bacteroidetes bacterium]|nr:RagB/SusD family nutrient uptake outer membrane protein [Bacteroidota bacterium]